MKSRGRRRVLRATFPTVGPRPVQAVHGELAAISIVDLTSESPIDRLGRARSACEKEARRPFDLAEGPNFRFDTLPAVPTEHVLLIVVHHIAFDGWSIGLLLQELATLYTAYSEGGTSPLPEPPIRYSDFACDQRQRLSGEVLDGHVAFWRTCLHGIPPHLALPFDHLVSAGRNYRGGRHPVVVGEELTEPLKALSRSEGVTLYMSLLAAFAALISRYTGEDDVMIGTPIAQRPMSAKTRALLGAFMNTVVLRTDLSGEPSFRELIARTRRTALAAYAHQELPYNILVGALNPDRDSTGPSLLQVMLIFQNMPDRPLELPGLKLELWDIHTGATRFDLTLELRERAGRIVGWFDYDRDLFNAGTIDGMAGHFQTLLGAALADPDRSVNKLPLLTEGERSQLIEAGNGTPIESPRDACLHHLFEAQVGRTPDRVALIVGAERLTYRELNLRAKRWRGDCGGSASVPRSPWPSISDALKR